MARIRSLAQFDWILLVSVLVLCGLGVMNLYSIPGSHATGRYLAQIYWVAIGLVLTLVLWLVDYRLIARLAYPIYIASLLLLVLVLVGPESLAPVRKGARRWLDLGPISFQPSELAKVGLILVLSRYFHDHPSKSGYGLTQIAYPLLVTAAPMALILKQPDLGTALLLLFIAATLILFARLKWSALAILAGLTVVALPVTWTMLSDYQKDRIYALFNPEVDKKKKGWQSQQAVIATSSGALTGKGFRQGTQTQLRYVPEQWNDFAFSGWAEEWGFLGCFFLLLLYYFFILWGLHISSQAPDRLGAFLVLGFCSLVFWHVVINVGMVTRLLPVVGIPLPFYSYGGTALLTMMFGVGTMMSVSARR